MRLVSDLGSVCAPQHTHTHSQTHTRFMCTAARECVGVVWVGGLVYCVGVGEGVGEGVGVSQNHASSLRPHTIAA